MQLQHTIAVGKCVIFPFEIIMCVLSPLFSGEKRTLLIQFFSYVAVMLARKHIHN